MCAVIRPVRWLGPGQLQDGTVDKLQSWGRRRCQRFSDTSRRQDFGRRFLHDSRWRGPQSHRGGSTAMARSIAASIRGRITSSTLWRSKRTARSWCGGQFLHLGGGGTGTTARFTSGRLNSDGSLDTGFDPGANGLVYALRVDKPTDRAILVGGTVPDLGRRWLVRTQTPRNHIGSP